MDNQHRACENVRKVYGTTFCILCIILVSPPPPAPSKVGQESQKSQFWISQTTDHYKVDNSEYGKNFMNACCFDKIMRPCYFRSPLPSVEPGGHNGQFLWISHHNWSQSWPISIKLHGYILLSGPVISMILQHDTMIYLPLATILKLLKLDFFVFTDNSLISSGKSTWVFMLVRCMDNILNFIYFGTFPNPIVTPRGHTVSLKSQYWISQGNWSQSWHFNMGLHSYFIDKHHALYSCGFTLPR